MKKYIVHMACTAVYAVDIEAENAEDAQDQAEQLTSSWQLGQREPSSTNDWYLMKLVELK